MATIVVRIDVTITSAYTKTTLPANPNAGLTAARTLGSTDDSVNKIAEINRKFWVDQFQALDPSADADVTITTQTTT